MNLYGIKNALYSSLFLSALVSSAFANHAGTIESTAITAPGKFYVGVFGGSSSSSQLHVSQLGSAFYTEAEGGPLSVNAFGNTNSPSAWVAGAEVGYQAQEILINTRSEWAIGPAIEFEGYSLGSRTFIADLANNTARLPEHEFVVNYPMKRNVFLSNFVLSLNNRCYLFHPYIGVGVGGATVKISGAESTQVDPLELGINHYNANNNDTSVTFAGQVKIGLSYDLNKYFSLFAEYRWLTLSNTQFTFGSTVDPTHVETTDWQVKLGPQHYNIGTVGIRFNL